MVLCDIRNFRRSIVLIRWYNFTMLSSIGALACSSNRIIKSNTTRALNRTSTTLHREGANVPTPMALYYNA